MVFTVCCECTMRITSNLFRRFLKSHWSLSSRLFVYLAQTFLRDLMGFLLDPGFDLLHSTTIFESVECAHDRLSDCEW